ncbi:MAG: hypothetical protein A2832_00760 [Candidatus Zambryskibacteria bacterium RIFCSPHIGHO2_01_FULL_44_22b]|uniref:RNA polymerase sigma-70 region 2 domain-containing protein n=2 Tax=Candidatus Zambryskiibacteriota TaxID=1817925 RepID=A0A1G2T0L1_9BACT|nr:MAG: hypothetical protein A2832_00760 [Candidatus Zambryskibacteria bacterium RIFCSPHIGHO2_01_FULL_44_22b]OHB04506.1 MAG: hypothetical protein A3B16_02965 [Candidatus Zambryskibacteria bacterium RIFCSPLOWO2_01_FULL_45_43]
MEVTMLSDAEVLKNSQTSPWMFGILVDRYEEAFIRKGEYVLRSREDAEDAVQDTFLKIYKYASKFSERKNASFQSWAYKILTNTCYTHLSKKMKEIARTQMLDFAELDVVNGLDNSEEGNRSSVAQSILLRLPERLSRLLSLYFFEDKSYAEIADVEHISISAVRSGLHRAKKQFKELGVEIS